MSLTTEWMSSHVETVRPHITSHHTLAPSPGDPPPPPCSVLRGLKRTLYGLLGTAHAILCPMRLQVRPFFATHGGPIGMVPSQPHLPFLAPRPYSKKRSLKNEVLGIKLLHTYFSYRV